MQGGVLYFGMYLRVLQTAKIPAYWRWYDYVNFPSYGLAAQVINEFKHRPGIEIAGVPILEYYDMAGAWNEWGLIAGLAVFISVFCIMAWAGFQWKAVTSR